MKAGRKKGSKDVVEKKYTKVNRKSYKNLTWLNRMYERRVKENLVIGTPLLKVIYPIKFPDGYKLFNEKEEYYGTIVQSNDIFLYIVPHFADYAIPFLKDRLWEYYVWAQDNRYGLTVPLELVKDYERPD